MHVHVQYLWMFIIFRVRICLCISSFYPTQEVWWKVCTKWYIGWLNFWSKASREFGWSNPSYYTHSYVHDAHQMQSKVTLEWHSGINLRIPLNIFALYSEKMVQKVHCLEHAYNHVHIQYIGTSLMRGYFQVVKQAERTVPGCVVTENV